MAHPRLVAARDALLAAIHERAPNSLILVLGPTGVGKTTLCRKIEQLMITEMLADLQTDPGRLPVVSVECIAPESGTFSWRDHFRRLLMQMEEPLMDYKLDPGTSIQIGNGRLGSCRTRKRRDRSTVMRWNRRFVSAAHGGNA